MDCQYTFVFDKTEMYDYKANRGYSDDLSKKGGCSQGAPYTPSPRDAVTNEWVKHGDEGLHRQRSDVAGHGGRRGHCRRGARPRGTVGWKIWTAAKVKVALSPDGRPTSCRRTAASSPEPLTICRTGIPRTLPA